MVIDRPLSLVKLLSQFRLPIPVHQEASIVLGPENQDGGCRIRKGEGLAKE
jgi:hypothetical protein